MNEAVTLMVLLMIVAVIASTVLYGFIVFPRPLPPVQARLSAGNIVYLLSGGNYTVYVVPVRFSVQEDSVWVGVCRVSVVLSDETGNTTVASALLSSDGYSYARTAPLVAGNSSIGNITVEEPVIRGPLDTSIGIVINGTGYHLDSLILYYCRYGEPTPAWNEPLLVPEKPLS